MSHAGLLPVICREVVKRATFPREPEPALVMDDPEQVKAYADAGRVDGLMSAAYLFHSARISQVIRDCGHVVDLGCGPATQLCQIAMLNPGIRFTGVDLSASMLESAEDHVLANKLTNVDFVQGDFTRLHAIPSASADAVISTLALHHLPSLEHLEACFREIARILKYGGAIYLADFGRLKSLKSVLYFAYMNAKSQPHIFSLDYERSLRAAFGAQDLAALAKRILPSSVRVCSTFLAPLLVIAQTPSLPLSNPVLFPRASGPIRLISK